MKNKNDSPIRLNVTCIDDALRRLLHSNDGDAFLIVEQPQSGKFVQFYISSEGRLVCDIPKQVLDVDEYARVREIVRMFDDVVTMTSDGFELVFENSTTDAASFAFRVFKDVYLCSDEETLHASGIPLYFDQKSGLPRCHRCGPGAFIPWTTFGYLCARCRRKERYYTFLGMALLLSILVAIAAVWTWLKVRSP